MRLSGAPTIDGLREDEVEGMRMRFRAIAKLGLGAALAAVGCLSLARPLSAAEEPRHIEVTAKRFEFAPAEITLKKGEPVVLVFHSEDVTHGIKFKELDLQMEIPKGDASELKFTPDTAGDFVGHCSRFCGVGHGSMTLTLHVTE
jgi:cytochrome c oxidase subunit 2